MVKSKKFNEFCILLLFVLQVLDGILTYFGVLRYGIEVEGNILIKQLMYEWGIELALVVTKLISIYLVFLVYIIFVSLNKISILSYLGLYFVIAFFLAFSIVPWTYLLFWF